jgi:hypothetical protein
MAKDRHGNLVLSREAQASGGVSVWRDRPWGKIEPPEMPRFIESRNVREWNPRYGFGQLEAMLDGLGIADPSGAVEAAREARAFIRKAPELPPVGDGTSLDPEEIARDVAAKVDRTKIAAESRSRRDRKAVTMLREAHRLLRQVDWVEDVIRPEVDTLLIDAAKKGATHERGERWTALHKLGQRLRIAAAASRLSEAREAIFPYQFGEADEAKWWVLENSRRVHDRYVRETIDGPVILLEVLDGEAPLTLEVIAQHPEWRPGIFTAEETLEHSRTWSGVGR